MVEMAPAGATGDFQLSYAGDTFNTAYYLHALRPDWKLDYASRVGDDAISQQMIDFIASHGIGVEHVLQSAGQTVGLYMISLQDGERSFSYWRGQSAAKQLAAQDADLAAAVARADIVYFSGITLAILDAPGRARLLRAASDARRAGAVIAFDPNLRPKLWSDNGTMCEAIMQAAAISDIVLPSHDDEATHFGDADPQATLARYRQAGSTTIVVKNGDGPILYSYDGGEGVFEPPAVKQVVDSTAAGDSFNAAILAGFEPATDIGPDVEHACALAGKVICGRGALVDLSKEVEQ